MYILKSVLLILFIGSILIIIFLHLNNQNEYLYRNRLENNTSLIKNLILIKPRPYLWCVNHYGPNNQLKDFFKCCIIAMINNYTLIIPPLYPHYGDDIRGIQWFDHFYDLKQLKLVLNFVTLNQFILENMNNKKLLIDCYIRHYDLIKNRMWYPLNTLTSIKRYYKININFNKEINLTRQFNMYELANKSKICSSIFLHIHYTTFNHFFLSPNIYTKSIFQYFNRNPLIQRMTSQLIKNLPKLVINNRKNSSLNQLNILAVIHIRLGDFTIMSVSMYIKQILDLIKIGVRFTHLHIMCPYLNNSHIKELKDSLPIAFTTTQQILPHVRYILDGYLFDVLEQEVAYQSPIFIASPWTTYSATVVMQKVYQDKGIVYVVSRNGKTPPLLVTKKNVKYFK